MNFTPPVASASNSGMGLLRAGVMKYSVRLRRLSGRSLEIIRARRPVRRARGGAMPIRAAAARTAALRRPNGPRRAARCRCGRRRPCPSFRCRCAASISGLQQRRPRKAEARAAAEDDELGLERQRAPRSARRVKLAKSRDRPRPHRAAPRHDDARSQCSAPLTTTPVGAVARDRVLPSSAIGLATSRARCAPMVKL